MKPSGFPVYPVEALPLPKSPWALTDENFQEHSKRWLKGTNQISACPPQSWAQHCVVSQRRLQMLEAFLMPRWEVIQCRLEKGQACLWTIKMWWVLTMCPCCWSNFNRIQVMRLHGNKFGATGGVVYLQIFLEVSIKTKIPWNHPKGESFNTCCFS